MLRRMALVSTDVSFTAIKTSNLTYLIRISENDINNVSQDDCEW
jgi:hypothetical protein